MTLAAAQTIAKELGFSREQIAPDRRLCIPIPMHPMSLVHVPHQTEFHGPHFITVISSEDALPNHRLVGGTVFHFCREDQARAYDYLVIDEAGQVALADALVEAGNHEEATDYARRAHARLRGGGYVVARYDPDSEAWTLFDDAAGPAGVAVLSPQATSSIAKISNRVETRCSRRLRTLA